MPMTDLGDEHLKGLLRLIGPNKKDRAKRQLASEKGRAKWLKRLHRNISMHPEFSSEPLRGERSNDHLLTTLRRLGAGQQCYVVASDSHLDDSFQSLENMVHQAGTLFGHGTILSCIPGILALFRQPYPNHTLIVHRPVPNPDYASGLKNAVLAVAQEVEIV
jgi:hypothetical protein